MQSSRQPKFVCFSITFIYDSHRIQFEWNQFDPYMVYHYLIANAIVSTLCALRFLWRFCFAEQWERQNLLNKMSKINIRLESLNLILSHKHLLSCQFSVLFLSTPNLLRWFFFCEHHWEKENSMHRTKTHEDDEREKKIAVFFSLASPRIFSLLTCEWRKKKLHMAPFFLALCSVAVSIAGKLALIAFW